MRRVRILIAIFSLVSISAQAAGPDCAQLFGAPDPGFLGRFRSGIAWKQTLWTTLGWVIINAPLLAESGGGSFGTRGGGGLADLNLVSAHAHLKSYLTLLRQRVLQLPPESRGALGDYAEKMDSLTRSLPETQTSTENLIFLEAKDNPELFLPGQSIRMVSDIERGPQFFIAIDRLEAYLDFSNALADILAVTLNAADPALVPALRALLNGQTQSPAIYSLEVHERSRQTEKIFVPLLQSGPKSPTGLPSIETTRLILFSESLIQPFDVSKLLMGGAGEKNVASSTFSNFGAPRLETYGSKQVLQLALNLSVAFVDGTTNRSQIILRIPLKLDGEGLLRVDEAELIRQSQDPLSPDSLLISRSGY